MGSFRRIEDPDGHIAWILELTYDNLIAMRQRNLQQLQSGLQLIELAFAQEPPETPLADIDIVDLERRQQPSQT